MHGMLLTYGLKDRFAEPREPAEFIGSVVDSGDFLQPVASRCALFAGPVWSPCGKCKERCREHDQTSDHGVYAQHSAIPAWHLAVNDRCVGKEMR